MMQQKAAIETSGHRGSTYKSRLKALNVSLLCAVSISRPELVKACTQSVPSSLGRLKVARAASLAQQVTDNSSPRRAFTRDFEKFVLLMADILDHCPLPPLPVNPRSQHIYVLLSIKRKAIIALQFHGGFRLSTGAQSRLRHSREGGCPHDRSSAASSIKLACLAASTCACRTTTDCAAPAMTHHAPKKSTWWAILMLWWLPLGHVIRSSYQLSCPRLATYSRIAS